MGKVRIEIFLEEEDVIKLDKYAAYLTEERVKQDIINKIPPSKRGRNVSRSKAAREILIDGLKKKKKG